MKTGDVTCIAKTDLQSSFWNLFGASGGPLRTRRRLTRAQRRPQERRNERRGAIWQRAAARQQQQQQQQQQSAAAAAAAAAQASRDNLCSSDASEASDASVASAASAAAHGAGPSNAEAAAAAASYVERHFARGDGCPLRLLESRDSAILHAGDAEEAFSPPPSPPPSPPAGAPSPAPSPPASPAAAPAATTVVPAKDALQHRLMLLRRRDGLIDITIRTMKLMRRNQQLQYRLMALQAETRAFVRSVLSNPENRGLRLTPAPSQPAFAPASSSASSPALIPALCPALCPALSSALSPALSPAPSPALTPATSPSSAPNPVLAMARP